MNIHVLEENSLNIPRGLYTSWLGNALSDVNANLLISQGTAILTNIVANGGEATYATDASGNVIGVNAPSGTILIGETPSEKLLACVVGKDISTTFLDVTSNANNLIVEAGNSTAFDIEGFFKTTSGSTTGGLNIPQASIRLNPYSESFILSFVLNRAAPTASEIIFSLGAIQASYQGFYLSHRTSGAIRIVPLLHAGGSASGSVDSTFNYSEEQFETYTKKVTLQAATLASVDGTITIPKNTRIVSIQADSTVAWTATTASLTVGTAAGGTQYVSATDVKTITRAPTTAYTAAQLLAMDNVGANTSIVCRVASTGQNAVGTTVVTVTLARPKSGVHITIAFDAPTGSWYLYKDGVLDPVSASYVGFSTGANAFSNVVTLGTIRFGGLAAASGATMVSLLANSLQFGKYNGALPSNLSVIASRLSSTPTLPIKASEW